MSVEQKLIESDMEAVNLGNLNTVEFDLLLPSVGENGSRITWESSDTRFIKRNGKVIQPRHGSGKRQVKLTARFQYGNMIREKDYHVTVLEEYDHFVITSIHPIKLTAQINQPVDLPETAIVETADHEVISHTIDWGYQEEPIFTRGGTYKIKGVLLHTTMTIYAMVEVLEAYEEPLYHHDKAVSAFQHVTLLECSSYYDAQMRMKAFLLSCDDDQMLYNFRSTCGLDVHHADPMIGWDTMDSKLRGHTTGHYLSALALCYRATRDEAIRKKAIYMVQELRLCQLTFAALGYTEGYVGGFDERQFEQLEQFQRYPAVWAPYYSLHKLFAGVLDCYELLQIQEAYDIVVGLGNYTYERLHKLPRRTLKKMWGIYIAGEYGGMNESLARLYQISKQPKHLAAARMFDNDRLFIPMQANVDALCGLHVNQHIPQVIGAFYIWKGSNIKRYYDIATHFWDIVTSHHCYANGGAGEGEIFHASDTIARMIDDNTAETCASYNMLKLTRELYQYQPKVTYMDYYERVMINHILASEFPKVAGGSTYFMPMEPGSHKSFEDENNCCHGTGMENQFKYMESIYFYAENCLYVNLFLSSKVEWGQLQLIQQVDETKPGHLHMEIQGKANSTIAIRIPYWCQQPALVEVNHQKASYQVLDGYLHLCSDWDNDCIDVVFPAHVYIEATSDDASIISIHYGPYLLAALDESQDYLNIRLSDQLDQQFLQKEHTLHFYDVLNQITFCPLYQIQEERYHVYVKRKQ